MEDDTNAPGRSKYTKGGYKKGMLCNVNSVEEFAILLGVPLKAMDYVEPTNDICKTKGCEFNAVYRNGGHCVCHQRSWYPLKHKKGGDLLGLEFERDSGHRRSCDCGMDACLRAGYFPDQDPIPIPHEYCQELAKHPLLSSKDKELINNGHTKTYHINAWHFFPEHLTKGRDKQWRLDLNQGKYYDKERKHPYDFPPPRNTVNEFLNETGHFSGDFIRPQERWAQENKGTKMPNWMLNMMCIDGEGEQQPQQKNESAADLRRTLEMWRARALYMKGVEEQHATQLSGMKRKHNEICEEKDKVIEGQQQTIQQLEGEKSELEETLEKNRQLLEDFKANNRGRPLRYRDLHEGGILSKHVDAFTLFNTFEKNDAFLDILNYTDGTEGSYKVGDGLCENLRPYSSVEWEEREGKREFQCVDPESDEYKSYLSHRRAALNNGMTWKDDYLAFCIYVRAGTTQAFAASLMGISTKRMSDIFHEWAQVLDDALKSWFPRPTHSQLLRAYPSRFIEAHDNARCFMLLDAFEIFTQESSNVNVSSSTHSDYKGHTTAI